jgi:ribosomal protein S18 acetylase RimI-like enzyme
MREALAYAFDCGRRRSPGAQNSGRSRFMGNEVVIEPATEDGHLSEIQKLAYAIWREHYPGIISSEQIEYMLREGYSLEALRRDSSREAIRYDRALVEGALVGFSAYGPHSDVGALALHKLYVEAAQRGRGCARKLVEAAAEHALANSLNRVILRVNKHNRIAVAAYERIGFVNRGSIVSDIGSGFSMDDYRMQLDL